MRTPTYRMLPHDQIQRDRFVKETERNFSVMASAGGGKTRAISDRIVELARLPNAVEVLSVLKVVTFTQKSAQELRDRARSGIMEMRPSPQVLSAFNRAFFGTLHSFAVAVLKTHGHFIGVPSSFEVLEDDALVWREFLGDHDGAPEGMDPSAFSLLTQIYPYADLLPLVRSYAFTRAEPTPCGEMPLLCFDDVFSFPYPSRKDTTANIKASQAELREWLEVLNSGTKEFNPVPYPEKGGKDYLATCAKAFAPLQLWIGRAVAETVHRLAIDYRRFRIRSGRLTFNDQVALAADVIKHPVASKELRSLGFRIILDEAQDTDLHQFTLLTEIVRPVSARPGLFLDTLLDGPRSGHFCMVGDKQQAIYGSRAELKNYLILHSSLCDSGHAEGIEFAVTFRCDSAIVDFANATFPPILSGSDRQVSYVPLIARPNADAGQVLRLKINDAAEDSSTGDKALHSARELGKWLAQTGPHALGANDWDQVALLCPRKDWFFPLRQGLSEAGLSVTFQSTREVFGDSPAWAWVAGLSAVWSEPNNHAEIFGVLREVFGHSDHDIAVFVDGDPSRLALTSTNPALHGISPVAVSLGSLFNVGRYFDSHPIREALGKAFETLDFCGRLASLPSDDYPHVMRDFSSLLMRASEAEARGVTLASFAKEIRGMLDKPLDTPVVPGSIPVITNLKSKGLQWDCVILPFFGREVSYRNEAYPRFLPEDCPIPLAFCRSDIPSEWTDRFEADLSHEAERVLYVSLTRPKHTLVLVDDCSVWSGDLDHPQERSFASWLRVSGVNAALWGELPSIANAVRATMTDPERFAFPEVILDVNPTFSEAADSFPRRLLPHTFADGHSIVRKIEDPEQQLTVSADTLVPDFHDSLAVSYGLWWHEFMQTIKWSAGVENWHDHFAASVDRCPDRSRGEVEWSVFLSSEAAHKLGRPNVRVLTEVPFMAPLSNGDSLDGVIDVAAHDPDSGWFVIDWKTNRGASGKSLVEKYAPQIKPYRDSISALTQSPAKGYIYATSSGEFVEV